MSQVNRSDDELARNSFSNDFNPEWQKLYNELCYEVFYRTENGKKLLSLLENRYFRSPVAVPGRDTAWAFLNEGRNELIRSFTASIQAHIRAATKK